MFINDIQAQSPKAYSYFLDFYISEYEDKYEQLDFDKLPFDYQLGVFIRFFDHINSDIQLYATEQNALKASVLEAFETYEEYLFLDS